MKPAFLPRWDHRRPRLPCSSGALAASAALVLAAAACAPDPPPPAAVPLVTMAPPPPEPIAPAAAARGPVRLIAEPDKEGPAAVRDERRRAARSTALLVVEIQSLEGLFRATSAGSPDRPLLARRLAESYVELARAAGRDPSGAKTVRMAHAAAIKYFEVLHAEYPKWCSALNAADPQRSTGCGDEVLYYLGLEAERAALLDKARRAYLDLLQGYPGSRHVPAAYVAFGEMFLAEASGDPAKLVLAEQAYAEALKSSPESRVHGLARYRLAQVQAKKGNDPEALASLILAADWAARHQDPGGLAAAVRREAIEVYARSGDPAQARAYFSRIASGAELDRALADLERRRGAP